MTQLAKPPIPNQAAGRFQNQRPVVRKLKPGPGLSRGEVRRSQRLRIHRAMVELAAQRGYRAVKVRDLAHLAGVSTRTFYGHFENTEDCFAGTLDRLVDHALRTASACPAGPDWRGKTRARVRSLMEVIADDPAAARLVLVEVYGAGPTPGGHLRAATVKLRRFLAGTIATAPDRLVAPSRLVTAIVDGATHIVRTTLITGKAGELPGLAGQIGDWIVALPSSELLRLRKLDPSGHGWHPEPVSTRLERNYGDERARMLNAAARLARLGGIEALTPSRIRADAGVSRRSFDANFSGAEECLLEAVEVMALRAVGREAECLPDDADVDWRIRTQCLVSGLCRRLVASTEFVELVGIDVGPLGIESVRRRDALISRAAHYVRASAPEARRPALLPLEASISAAWSLIEAEMTAGRARGLDRVAPFLSYLVLAPAIGPAPSVEAILAGRAGAR